MKKFDYRRRRYMAVLLFALWLFGGWIAFQATFALGLPGLVSVMVATLWSVGAAFVAYYSVFKIRIV